VETFKLVGGRVDRVSGSYMRLDVGMRGFGGGKLVCTYITEPSIQFGISVIDHHPSSARLGLHGGGCACSAAIIITWWGTVRQQSQKTWSTRGKENSGVG
jgi:hypothetical protein